MDNNLFADVILPLSVPNLYTYQVSGELGGKAAPGVRVVVQFGKKRFYTAIIAKVHAVPPTHYKAKTIDVFLDGVPLVSENQLNLWKWIAEYYMCNIGDVMNAALPAALKLESETTVVPGTAFNERDNIELNDDEFQVAEALESQHELNVHEIQQILDKKSVHKTLQSLIEKDIIRLKEELKQGYKPKMEKLVRLNPNAENNLEKLFNELEKFPKQLQLLMRILQLSKLSPQIKKSELMQFAEYSESSLKTLVKKGVLEVYEVAVDRLDKQESDNPTHFQLSDEQQRALSEINVHFEHTKPALLHGVTSSGKTQVYIKLIEDQIKKSKQVLYLLPEIALTSQIIGRLQKVFGDEVGVYHSKFSSNERVEIWNKTAAKEYKVLIGARSAIFLPFKDLGLIIIDEEHDASFKQFDPSPRYNARDTSLYLAKLFSANVVLGSATPSIESYYNAVTDKYGLVEIKERYKQIPYPEIVLADVKEEKRKKLIKEEFTTTLLEEIKKSLDNKEQVILFQNRRGYAPYLTCQVCGDSPQCKDCDVSLTYHKFKNQLRCHYCGFKQPVIKRCPGCGDTNIKVEGFGTEKIEETLQLFFPEAKLARMDHDTVRNKRGHENIIELFETRKVDILVGTQMVTKGLDFDHVSMVGIISADQLMNFPDFRAYERAFQLMLQVSGRAGRKNKRGKVVIQTMKPNHPIFMDIIAHDYLKFYGQEIYQRDLFKYPPFYRLIKISLKHKKPETVKAAAEYLGNHLKNKLGKRVIGPAVPYIGKVRGYYLEDILVKMERDKDNPAKVKKIITELFENLSVQKAYNSVFIHADVDPY